jgi:hypothetical protein
MKKKIYCPFNFSRNPLTAEVAKAYAKIAKE